MQRYEEDAPDHSNGNALPLLLSGDREAAALYQKAATSQVFGRIATTGQDQSYRTVKKLPSFKAKKSRVANFLAEVLSLPHCLVLE